MSRIFKSDYVQMGAPKPIKNTYTQIIKKQEPEKNLELTAEEIAITIEKQSGSIIDDAKEMYLRIIEEANFEARNIVDKAHQEAEIFVNTTREEGFNEGFQAGFQEGLNNASSIIEAAIEARAYLEYRKNEIYSEAEEQILRLVLDISKKVIGQELTQNNEVIISIIRLALEKCAYKSKLMLRVSAEDFEFVESNKEVIIRLTEGLNDLEVIKDISLSKGGCIIETQAGEINSSAEVQFRELEKAFYYVLRNE